jgi:hypothetical protein
VAALVSLAMECDMPVARVLALLLPIVLVGCTHHCDLKFRMVDSKDGQPLEDVEAALMLPSWRPSILLLIPGRVWFLNPTYREKTAADGIVRYDHLRSDIKIRIFKKGYHEVVVDRIWPSIKLLHSPEAETYVEEIVDGAIVVPLERETEETVAKPDESTEP